MRSQITTIRLQLLEQSGDSPTVEAFIHDNLVLPEMRAEAIARACASRDFEHAIALAKAGIAQSEGRIRRRLSTGMPACLRLPNYAWKPPT